MLEEPDQPPVEEVPRVQPTPGEKPVPGFSWADYEDVQAAAEDADGEDDGGWGVVKSRSRNSMFHHFVLVPCIDGYLHRARTTAANRLSTPERIRNDQKTTTKCRQARSPESGQNRG